MNDHLFGKSYLCLSICVCASFTFGFEGGAWDLTELVPTHCLSSLVDFRQT